MQEVIEQFLSQVVGVGYAVEVSVFVDHCDEQYSASEFTTWAQDNSGLSEDGSYQIYAKRLGKRNTMMVHRLK